MKPAVKYRKLKRFEIIQIGDEVLKALGDVHTLPLDFIGREVGTVNRELYPHRLIRRVKP